MLTKIGSGIMWRVQPRAMDVMPNPVMGSRAHPAVAGIWSTRRRELQQLLLFTPGQRRVTTRVWREDKVEHTVNTVRIFCR